MTATAIPTRMLLLLGLALAAAAAFLVARPLLLSDDDTASPAPAAVPAPTKPAATPSKPATSSTKTAPKLVLLPDVPSAVAKRLRFSKVVVVSAYAGTSKSDRAAVAQARAGAKDVGSGFVALNVLDERTARQLQPFAGTVSAPVVLVVRRPGKIVKRFETRVDSALVAQAARNAGAGR